jgi:hypothetical protein
MAVVTLVRRMRAKGLRRWHATVSSSERSGDGVPLAGMGRGLGQSEVGSSGSLPKASRRVDIGGEVWRW